MPPSDPQADPQADSSPASSPDSTNADLSTDALVPIALAILYDPRSPRFLMQLRDDVPHILYPGCWGLFGGHLEPGEAALDGLQRELHEELSWCPASPDQLEPQPTAIENGILRHLFASPLTVPLDQLVLGEGQDLGWIDLDAVQAGQGRSPRLQALRPLGTPHRQMLLNFAQRQGWLPASPQP
jgi:8-oxo-dGTP pyrophosphatase MutT (NUDIX family)